MTRVEFRVDGKPPKKIRGKSLWTKKPQCDLIKTLREKAHRTKESSGIDTLTEDITLKIEIHIPQSYNIPTQQQNFVGDLDNLISGISEALMKPWPTYVHYQQDPAQGNQIMYNDDSQIQSIYAEKIIEPEQTTPYYLVSIQSNN